MGTKNYMNLLTNLTLGLFAAPFNHRSSLKNTLKAVTDGPTFPLVLKLKPTPWSRPSSLKMTG